MAKITIVKEEWLQAITDAGGMVTLVAQRLGINRNTVARLRDATPWIKKAFEETQFKTTDLAQRCLQTEVQTNWKAAAWWLERLGKDRGFGKELKIDANIEQVAKVVLYLPNNCRNPGMGPNGE